jgi:hypothetical protein
VGHPFILLDLFEDLANVENIIETFVVKAG